MKEVVVGGFPVFEEEILVTCLQGQQKGSRPLS